MRDGLFQKFEEQGKNTDSIRNIITQRLDFTHDQIQTLDKNLAQTAGAVQKQLSAISINQRKSSATLIRGQGDLGRKIGSQCPKATISSTHQEFLDSLFFPEMFVRQESIKKNLPGTYDWVFDGKLPRSDEVDSLEDHKKDEELRGRIVRWLRETNGSPVFWVSGKSGSGKSSLMAFIMSDKRTAKCMQTWAGGQVPHIFSFFFWKPGSTLQKTMTGFRRSLLWQLCKAKPAIIDDLVSRDPALLYSPWLETKLIDALKFALSAYRKAPVLYVIDGLDECECNHSDLLDELQDLNLSSYTKVCISSRPEEAFHQRLGTLPFIRLQDLNYDDILKFAHVKLSKGGDRMTKLAVEVADHAEGVFLWAVLVCDSLHSGLMSEDDETILLQRLHSYPKGLDDLFDRMFANLEEVHYKSLAFYFYAAQQQEFTVALAAASQPTQHIYIWSSSARCVHAKSLG